MNTKQLLLGLGLASALAMAGATDSAPANTNTLKLAASPQKIHNRTLTTLMEAYRQVFRLDARKGDGVAWWPDSSFTNGTIELELRGTNVFQKSFVGVAFHGLNATNYDAIYFRPFNFQSEDKARRSHGVQYIAHPHHAWNNLRDQHPGKFESETVPAPDPNAWLQVRIDVEHPLVRVFVNQAEQPVLTVNQLSDRKHGWIGIWTGNGSGGDFANLRVTAR